MRSIIFACLLFVFLYGHSKKPYIQKGQKGHNVSWELIWHDEFNNPKTIDNNWISENKAPTHIISSRWRENISTEKGTLKINNKKEKRGEREWTSGSITCKEQFCYGYFECRMKISAATGLNNSFWFYQWTPSKVSHAFEIDVVEAHYPNKIQTNVHDCGTISDKYRVQDPKKFIPKVNNLSDGYHIYGMWWTKNKIYFYFDGQLVRNIDNNTCHQKANMVLGTAVMPWAGAVTDDIDGTSMTVDYVRVWQQK